MSRFNYDDEGEWWSYALWQGRVKQATNGRPALRSYRELEAALLALPQPRLIDDSICDGQDVCPIGAFAVYKIQQDTGVPRSDILRALAEEWDGAGSSETAELGSQCGMTRTLAWVIAEDNDEGWPWNMTPEERYTATLASTRKSIARLEAKFNA